MNATPKKIIKSALREQKRKFVTPDEPSVELLLSETADFKKIWAEEIKQLKTQSYLNIEAAVTALVRAVVKRFCGGEQSKEISEVLKLYIESDPDLLEQIENILINKD